MEKKNLKNIVKEAWKNNYIKGSVLGLSLMLGTGIASKTNYVTMPTNSTYEQSISLDEEINRSYDVNINSDSDKEKVIASISDYFEEVDLKKNKLDSLTNTPEYKQVIKARENREEIGNYLSKIGSLGGGLAVLSLIGGMISDKRRIEKNYEVKNDS